MTTRSRLLLELEHFTILTLAGSFVNALPRLNWIQEINSNFALIYLVLHILSLLLFLVFWRSINRLVLYICVPLLIFFAYANFKPIRPFYFGPLISYVHEPEAVTAKARIFFANVFEHNEDPTQLSQLIEDKNADIVALLEYDEGWSKRLPLKNRYPYSHELLDAGTSSFGIYSTFPLSDVETFLGEDMPPALFSTLTLPGNKTATLSLFHAPQPIGAVGFWKARILQRRAAMKLRHSDHDAIVLTDLNSTPFSRLYQGFVYAARLEDVQWGRGIFEGTWNALWPFRPLRVDYVFYKGAIKLKSVERTPAFGSDHLGYVVDFEL